MLYDLNHLSLARVPRQNDHARRSAHCCLCATRALTQRSSWTRFATWATRGGSQTCPKRTSGLCRVTAGRAGVTGTTVRALARMRKLPKAPKARVGL
jgi:hypothetical protein